MKKYWKEKQTEPIRNPACTDLESQCLRHRTPLCSVSEKSNRRTRRCLFRFREIETSNSYCSVSENRDIERFQESRHRSCFGWGRCSKSRRITQTINVSTLHVSRGSLAALHCTALTNEEKPNQSILEIKLSCRLALYRSH